MKLPQLFSAVQPFIAAIAVLCMALLLVVAIYFTLLELEWIAFLTGCLSAAVLAMVTRATQAEQAAASAGAKLAVSEGRLLDEIADRESLQRGLERAKQRLHFADDTLPVMVAFIDRAGIYRYHNHAFRRWLDLPAHHIDGQPMQKVLGSVAYGQVEPRLQSALRGETVRYERTQKMANGTVFRLYAQLIPVFDPQGVATGVYAVMTDITERRHLEAADGVEAIGEREVLEEDLPVGKPVHGKPSEGDAASIDQARYDDAVAQQATGLSNVRARISAAIERNEFTLFCQKIVPLDAASGRPRHLEILIRLIEEENNLIPPGAFFPLAEDLGMLPQLDRWVVAHLLEHLAAHAQADGRQGPGVYFLNVANATLADPDFPEFVSQRLAATGVPPGTLCFEVIDSELEAHRSDVEDFVAAIRKLGCRVALGGFGRGKVSVAILKRLPIDFLKIDGSIILQMLKDPVALGKVMTINRVAKVFGITTIAEMVEEQATMARLREIPVDYAQGFGISKPRPLIEEKQ